MCYRDAPKDISDIIRSSVYYVTVLKCYPAYKVIPGNENIWERYRTIKGRVINMSTILNCRRDGFYILLVDVICYEENISTDSTLSTVWY